MLLATDQKTKTPRARRPINMNRVMIAALIAVALVASAVASEDATSERDDAGRHGETASLFKALSDYAAARQAEFDQIDRKRKARLEELSAYIRGHLAAEQPVRMIFVCTHNSRRSQMSQLWAAVAAETYGIHAATYSGGTASTAFNPRAVAAMQRAGFQIEQTTDDSNPIYHVRCSDQRPAMTCFSKKYDSAPNPREGFAAVMVCSQADRSCPLVRGATGRIAIPYVDPKVADGTKQEAATYDERCAQIAREMLYVMSRAAGQHRAARRGSQEAIR
jgi:protein-tyrosine-phosphatase